MKEIVTRLGAWRIERTLGRDLSGTYYAARSSVSGREPARATLFLLAEPGNRDDALRKLIAVHAQMGAVAQATLVRLHGLEHDEGDPFLIGEPVDDELMPLRHGRRPMPGQARALGAALAAGLAAAHDRGLFHGGIELDNTLWSPDHAPRLLGAGVAALGMTDRDALIHGDVAALGRLLCALVTGWQPRGGRVDGTAADSRTIELVRLIADPGSAITMREAHALLASGDATQAGAARGSGLAEQPTVDDRRARRVPLRDVDVEARGELAGGATADGPRDSDAVGTDAGDGLDAARAGTASAGGTDDHAVPEAGPVPEGGPGGLLGRYRILTRLGRGGMGEVFLAEDPALRRGVAIKRIRPGLERDRTFRARLRREAQLAARLGHRAIVQVFDLVTEDNVDHVVMEYVPGPSLHALLAGNPMAVPEVLRIAAELADGLAYAHQQGIVHRDLKIENILINTDGQPKIADFGIARRAAGTGGDSAAESLTRDGFVVGTSRAMSPEQIQGHDVDARSDLFSFGVMLYELLSGVSPFAAEVDAQTILRVLHHRQAPVRELAPEVPRALSDLVDHLLEKSPSRRPDSARTVRDRLRRMSEPGTIGDARDAASEPPPPTGATSSLRRGGPAPAAPGSSTRSSKPSTSPPSTSPPSTSPSPSRGERRQVTLTCIDLVAAGDAGDDLSDPEPLADVLPAFRVRVDEILQRFDGVLISALGHRFIACFGHPRPLEDAARRAVLAGRALLAAAAELRTHDPVHTRARFTASGAVHTGLAVVRGSGSGEELVLGATLDAALRLLQLGKPGDLWLSGSASRLVETDFQLERPPSLPEGVTSARRFVGDTVASGSGSGEHDRPMVARDHEMQLLLGGWRQARKGRGQVALLIGDPGIGKSRLTRELATAIATEQPRQIVLRGSAHRQRSALEPVADALAALFDLDDAGAPTTTTDADAGAADQLGIDRIRALTGPDEAEQVLHLLGRAATLPAVSPDRARAQLLGGLRDVLVGTASEVPTLFLVEDLHWLDASTLDLLAMIVPDAASAPMFLLMTTRPGFQPPWPAAAAVTQLHLSRLEAAAIDDVIAHASAHVGAGRALSPAERALIATRSEGVPLYAEELVRAALDVGPGRTGDVPSTLRDALTARLHQLGPITTRVAHVAAVAGREFTAEHIAAGCDLDRAAIDQELERLVSVEILFRRRGRPREVLYQFRHVLLQQAAYEELLVADRRHLHGQLADALVAEQGAGRDPGAEIIAHHLAGARRFAEAIASQHQAALRMLGRHARVEARELFRQALTWLEQLPESAERDTGEVGLRMQLAAVLIATEGYASPELERTCQRAERLCLRHEDVPMPIKHGLWAVRFMRGGAEELAPLLGWFERIIEREGKPGDDRAERMMAQTAIGIYGYARSAYAVAERHLRAGMALFDPAEHPGVVQIYGGCGGFYGHVVTTGVLWYTGRFDEAWAHSRSIVAQAQSLDPYALVCALAWDMSLNVGVGDVAGTEAVTGRMLELTTRYEFPYLACSALCGRGWALARRGHGERGLADLVMGTTMTRQIGVKVWYPYYLGLLADTALFLGKHDQAEQAIVEGLELCRTSVDRGSEPEFLRLQGHLILGRDASAHGAARAALADALTLARERGAVAIALRAATDLATLLRDDNHPEEAAAVLTPVYRGFPAHLVDPNLAAARHLLDELPALPA